METNPDARRARPPIVWPWVVAGLLTPSLARLLTGPLPASIAAGLSFFVSFAAASYFVLRRADPPRPLARALAGAACGAVIVAALTEAFP